MLGMVGWMVVVEDGDIRIGDGDMEYMELAMNGWMLNIQIN